MVQIKYLGNSLFYSLEKGLKPVTIELSLNHDTKKYNCSQQTKKV